MKRIKIVCVGKASKPFCRDGCDEYLKRLKSFFDVTIVEIAEQPTVQKESELILKKTSAPTALLDIGGEQLSSEQFAAFVDGKHVVSDELCFVIGGASGVDDRVREFAEKRISFGRVTYPHQIVRILLLEQIYRAATIIKGLPYHKQ